MFRLEWYTPEHLFCSCDVALPVAGAFGVYRDIRDIRNIRDSAGYRSTFIEPTQSSLDSATVCTIPSTERWSSTSIPHLVTWCSNYLVWDDLTQCFIPTEVIVGQDPYLWFTFRALRGELAELLLLASYLQLDAFSFASASYCVACVCSQASVD